MFFESNKEFYPTPALLAEKMLAKCDMKRVASILEPSAGKGDLAYETARKLFESRHSSRFDYDYLDKLDIDTIEVSPELRRNLIGAGYRVVFDDFLNFKSFKKYDLIAMNPPFSNGELHLLKAISLVERYGGQICCILNAETIRNPYSHSREKLAQAIEKYSATVEFIENAFVDAERQTGVEVAIIYFDIPDNRSDCNIFDELQEAVKIREELNEETQVSAETNDFIHGIVKQFEFECEAGVKLIREFMDISPRFLTSFKEHSYYNKPILNLEINSHYSKYDSDMLNAYLKTVRKKYWEALFASDEFTKLMTSSMQDDYMSRISSFANYDFNLYNIYTLKQDILGGMSKEIENTIMELFETFAYKHSYSPEFNNCIHYYDGWSTNRCGVLGQKVIIPMYDAWNYRREFDPNYYVRKQLSDIEKVFNYLDGGETPETLSVDKVLDHAKAINQNTKIHFKYFTATFYKKGTLHLLFHDPKLIKRFNIFAGRKSGALPPCYGKKPYNSMTENEQKIINAFEGEKEYKKVLADKMNYLLDFTSDDVLPMLSVSENCA
ncbi:MAG: DUF4942 domain-containing protein [Oscillospiraceae bacterium]|nr:DUF4942 domain-containing protein [Oscillospiraceae bacterium]